MDNQVNISLEWTRNVGGPDDYDAAADGNTSSGSSSSSSNNTHGGKEGAESGGAVNSLGLVATVLAGSGENKNVNLTDFVLTISGGFVYERTVLFSL
jgi:hypothetical protein